MPVTLEQRLDSKMKILFKVESEILDDRSSFIPVRREPVKALRILENLSNTMEQENKRHAKE